MSGTARTGEAVMPPPPRSGSPVMSGTARTGEAVMPPPPRSGSPVKSGTVLRVGLNQTGLNRKGVSP